MEESTSREKILKKVRDALIEQTDLPYPLLETDNSVYQPMVNPLDVTFAQELLKVEGKFVFCDDEEEFLSGLQGFILEKEWPVLYCFDPVLQALLKRGGIPFEGNPAHISDAKLGITRCESLIARLGSIMVSSKTSPGRQLSVFPEIHLVVAYPSQLVVDLKQAFQNIRKKYGSENPSMISIITGPSRTADIEKTLVMGAHGPKELYVFLIDNEPIQHNG